MGLFTSAPRPDTRSISAKAPEVSIPLIYPAPDTVWLEWPLPWGSPAEYNDNPWWIEDWPWIDVDSAWPYDDPWSDRNDWRGEFPQFGAEADDFARRFMALAWALAFHRVDTNNDPMWPFFDIRLPYMRTPVIFNYAILWLLTCWVTHVHMMIVAGGAAGGIAWTPFSEAPMWDGTFYDGDLGCWFFEELVADVVRPEFVVDGATFANDGQAYRLGQQMLSGGTTLPYAATGEIHLPASSTVAVSVRFNESLRDGYATFAGQRVMLVVNNGAEYAQFTVELSAEGVALKDPDVWYDYILTIKDGVAHLYENGVDTGWVIDVFPGDASGSSVQMTSRLRQAATIATETNLYVDAVSWSADGYIAGGGGGAPQMILEEFDPLPDHEFYDVSDDSIKAGVAWLGVVEQVVYPHLGG